MRREQCSTGCMPALLGRNNSGAAAWQRRNAVVAEQPVHPTSLQGTTRVQRSSPPTHPSTHPLSALLCCSAAAACRLDGVRPVNERGAGWSCSHLAWVVERTRRQPAHTCRTLALQCPITPCSPHVGVAAQQAGDALAAVLPAREVIMLGVPAKGMREAGGAEAGGGAGSAVARDASRMRCSPASCAHQHPGNPLTCHHGQAQPTQQGAHVVCDGNTQAGDEEERPVAEHQPLGHLLDCNEGVRRGGSNNNSLGQAHRSRVSGERQGTEHTAPWFLRRPLRASPPCTFPPLAHRHRAAPAASSLAPGGC